MCLYTECRCNVVSSVDRATVIVIHGGMATGKTYNQDAFAKHYGMKVGGDVHDRPRSVELKSGLLYTSSRPIYSNRPGLYIRNITIARAFKDAGIKPFMSTGK